LNPSPFDSAYVTRLRDGDAETERHFVSHFSHSIRLSLGSRLRSRKLIEDIRQETFLRVLNFLRSDRSLDQPERLGAYVHSVSINVMMESLRASTRHPPIPEAQDQATDRHAHSGSAAVTVQRKELVRTMLADVSEKDRQVLRAVFLEEKESSEICRDLQVDRDYLRALIKRAALPLRGR